MKSLEHELEKIERIYGVDYIGNTYQFNKNLIQLDYRLSDLIGLTVHTGHSHNKFDLDNK